MHVLDYISFIIYELSGLIEEEEDENLCPIWHPKTIQWLNSELSMMILKISHLTAD